LSSGPPNASIDAPPRLLAVGPLPPPINGLSKAFSLLAEGVGQFGWDVKVVDLADRGTGREGSAFRWKRASEIGEVVLRVVRDLPSSSIVYLTISQSRWGFVRDLAILLAAAVARRPVVVHMHGGNFHGFYSGLTRPEQALVRSAMDSVSVIIVLTESLRADFRMCRDWSKRTVAIANTCDIPVGRERRHPGKRWHFLFLSNLLPSKGYREAIRALVEVANDNPDLSFELSLAGAMVPEHPFSDSSSQEADLRRLLDGLPPNLSAHYLGVMNGSAKRALLDAADVFLLPTTYINEGQPIAVIEALRVGLPVIATDWRGIRETLPAAMHQLLATDRTVEAVHDKISALLEDPLLYERLSREAIAHAGSFSPGPHLAALDAVFRSALVDGKPSAHRGATHVE